METHETTIDANDLHDLTRTIEGFLSGASIMGVDDAMAGAAAALWGIGNEEQYGEDLQANRLGQVLALKALAASPGALDVVPRKMLAALVAADPDLALLGEAPTPAALAVPRVHDIGDTSFAIDPEGNLTINPTGKRVLKLGYREAFSLLTFMRIPGVAELIEQKQAEFELRDWEDHQSDPETIEARQEKAREAAYELVTSDPILLARLRAQIEAEFTDAVRRMNSA